MNGPNFSGKLVLQNITVLRKKTFSHGGIFSGWLWAQEKLRSGTKKKDWKRWKSSRRLIDKKKKKASWVANASSSSSWTAPAEVSRLWSRSHRKYLFSFASVLLDLLGFGLTAEAETDGDTGAWKTKILSHAPVFLSLSLTLSLLQTHTRTSTLFLAHSLSLSF